jgi:hypothetical protein
MDADQPIIIEVDRILIQLGIEGPWISDDESASKKDT